MRKSGCKRPLLLFVLLLVILSVIVAPKPLAVERMAIPAKTYAYVGWPIKIYFLNATSSSSDENLVFQVDAGGVGYSTEEYWVYTPQCEETINLKIEAFDSKGALISSGSTIIEVREKSVQDNLSVLVIGDSTVEAGVITETLLQLADHDGYALTLLGTQGDLESENKHEGRGGWRADMYALLESWNHVINPFFNPERKEFQFDFSNYMEQQGYSKVDCVVIQLGINDVFLSRNDAELRISSQTYMEHMAQMIESIHLYDGKIKIIWNLILPCSVDENKFIEAYGDLQTAKRNKINTYETNIKIIENTDIDNVFIAPINISMDVVRNMSPGGHGAVHPGITGYKEIGTALYSFLRAVN